MANKIEKPEDEWREELTPEQFQVCRLGATERPFSGKYNDFKGKGIFVCACCGNPLFTSDTKFNSGTGWPSFFAPAGKDAVDLHDDHSLFMHRTEVKCARCDAHLGHVFDDGPPPTGKRFCMNSVALEFKPDEESADR